MKVIDKTKLDPMARGHLFQEVRCMKMVQHPNVVRLYEVIDTATKLYLILELGDGGDMYDCIMKHEGGLSEEVRLPGPRRRKEGLTASFSVADCSFCPSPRWPSATLPRLSTPSPTATGCTWSTGT